MQALHWRGERVEELSLDRANEPCVLIVAAKAWISTAQLAIALRGLGCRVDLLGPGAHPARVTGALTRAYRHNPLRPVAALERAIAKSKPDAIIPADEMALLQLHELAEETKEPAVAALLLRSLGSVAGWRTAVSRVHLLALASEQGIAVPGSLPAETAEDVAVAVETLGLPLVLKADASSGGEGVRIVLTEADALAAREELERPPLLLAVKYGLKGKQWVYLRPWMRGDKRRVLAQKLLVGRERTGMALAHEGRMIAFVNLEVVAVTEEFGPSSVLRAIDDPVMEATMRTMIEQLGVSGFCGFDFMMDGDSEPPLLIEMNPRPTQLVHFAFGPGRDLAAAYVREVLGRGLPDRPAATENPLIAVFQRGGGRRGGPESKAYQDVPWGCPRLMKWST